MPAYLERALFVVAPQNWGKSTQLRALFLDPRLGTGGRIPRTKKISETYALGRDRHLYLRLTSPHEYNESPAELIDKCRQKMGAGRWCFASPMQPDAANRMPDVVASVARFRKALSPERTRVVFLSRSAAGQPAQLMPAGRDLVQELQGQGVEVMSIDARHRTANGLLLADFFDFT